MLLNGREVSSIYISYSCCWQEGQEEKAPINLKIDSDNRVFPCFNARIARSITDGFCQLWGDLCVSYGA